MTEQPPEYVTDAPEMIGHKKEGNKIKDESNDRSYFVMTPRIVWAMTDDPLELALWETVKDIAGESRECIIATSDLAALAMMSSGALSVRRKKLIAKGLLKGELRKDPGYPQSVWHLTVPDVWKENVLWCESHKAIRERIAWKVSRKKPKKKSLHHMKPSPHERGVSPHERGVSPHETKNSIEVDQKEENIMPTPKIDLTTCTYAQLHGHMHWIVQHGDVPSQEMADRLKELEALEGADLKPYQELPEMYWPWCEMLIRNGFQFMSQQKSKWMKDILGYMSMSPSCTITELEQAIQAVRSENEQKRSKNQTELDMPFPASPMFKVLALRQRNHNPNSETSSNPDHPAPRSDFRPMPTFVDGVPTWETTK